MEKWAFGLSKKEVPESIDRYVNENKIPTPFRGGVPGDDFFIRSETCRKKSYLPQTSGEVRERIKETVSKTRERQEQTRKRKNQEKKKRG